MSDDVQAGRIEQLIEALRDDNEALRDHAIASLSQLGEEAIGPLIGLMADEDVLIREAATVADRRGGPAGGGALSGAGAENERSIPERAASSVGQPQEHP